MLSTISLALHGYLLRGSCPHAGMRKLRHREANDIVRSVRAGTDWDLCDSKASLLVPCYLP